MHLTVPFAPPPPRPGTHGYRPLIPLKQQTGETHWTARGGTLLTPARSRVGKKTRNEITNNKKPYVCALPQDAKIIQLGLGFKSVELEGKYLSAGVKKGKKRNPWTWLQGGV